MRTIVHNRAERLPVVAFCFLLSLFAIGTAGPGADAAKYSEWGYFFLTRKLDVFTNYPAHFITRQPIITWSFGPGSVWSTFSSLARNRIPIGAQTAGIFLGILNLSVGLLFTTTIKHRTIHEKIFLTSLIIFCTPVGFYFNHFSTEGLSVFLLLLFFFGHNKLQVNNRISPFNLLLCSSSMYLLVAVRFSYLPMAVILLLLSLYCLVKKNDLSFSQKIVRGAALISPMLWGVYSVSEINKLMSGNFFGPYKVGDQLFSTVSLNHLHSFEILIHSWHGLLIYHPIFIIFIYRLVRSMIPSLKSIGGVEVAMFLACLGIFLITFLSQAAWFIWWMGSGTFGARQFCASAIVIGVWLLSSRQSIFPKQYFSRCLLALVVFYSLLHYQIGISNFTSFAALWEGLRFQLVDFPPYLFMILICLYFCKVAKGKILDVSPLMIIPFVLIFGSFQFAGRVPVLVLFSSIVVSCLALRYHKILVKSLSATVLVLVLILIFQSAMNQNFLRNQLLDHALISSGDSSQIDCQEYTAALNEYQKLNGFAESKKNLADFLTRVNC